MQRIPAGTWYYLAGFIKKYDAVILSRREYQQKLPMPQLIFPVSHRSVSPCFATGSFLACKGYG
jgi:hypothetical protein